MKDLEGDGFELIEVLVQNLTRIAEENYERTYLSHWLDFAFVEV
jgi:hypothetical protein